MVKKWSSGPNNPGGVRHGSRRLVGSKVVASEPDEEMKDEVFEICHVEFQTWVDGEKHTVCIIKAEGKASWSREFSSLVIHDPFISRDATQSVRVVVIPHDVEHAQSRIGWRGIVQAAAASAPNVKVYFSFAEDVGDRACKHDGSEDIIANRWRGRCQHDAEHPSVAGEKSDDASDWADRRDC